MSNHTVNAGVVSAFLLLADPDRNGRHVRCVEQLQWRLFAEAILPIWPSFGLDRWIHDIPRDAQLAERVLSDGTFVRDAVEPGVTHAGWLTVLALGSKQNARDGHRRSAGTEDLRLEGAYALHETFFGPVAGCRECAAARASASDVVIGDELRAVEAVALVPA